MRSLVAVALLLSPVLAQAQPGLPVGMPLVVDMQKVQVGTWAEYNVKFSSLVFTARWALVARDDKSNTIEMTTKGEPFAKPLTLRMVLPADPTSDDKHVKPPAIQAGNDAPMVAPKDFPVTRFLRPQASTLVGSEEIKVAAGTFKTTHYRERNTAGTVDLWVSEGVHPIGIVKSVTTPENDKDAPAAMQITPYVQELVSSGTGAKPVVTKKPQPYDQRKVDGLVKSR
jgi:hypothetical protein